LLAWEDVVMPTAYPQEFHEDVLRVVAAREPGVTIKMIAKDFGIHVGTLDKWLREE
jgi:transposase-like protein